MQKSDPLIRTKVRLPFTRTSLVARPQLQARIVEGLCHPLTLVIAPAGFGKTTLVASCLPCCGMAVAWLSLDKEDNRPGRFLNYLVAALREADPTIGGEAAQLMQSSQPARPAAVMTSLINDLDAAGKEMALVLDDYYFISSQDVHGEVAFLLEHCPKTFHLLIATRSDPPLPLTRLRARGQAVELRTADLRFTAAEATLFLNDVMGLHLDAGSVAVLEERTEGWVAGLQMAALSMRDRKDVHGFIQGFSGTNRYILDYLLEEVLDSQPPEIQHYLLSTSILERLTAPLCDAVLEEYPSQRPSAEILNTLERENLFLLALDNDAASGAGATWFRYHHLFADLLRARLQKAQPDLIPRLHIRASSWLEQNGYIADAIQHLIGAREIGQAADLIERYGPLAWIENDTSIVQMAESLPSEILLARPKLGLYLAWLLVCQAHIERAVPLLNELARHLAGAEDHPESGWVHTVIECARAFLYPPGNLPGVSALDGIPADDPILRDAVEVLYGMALARRGDFDEAVQVSLGCIQKWSERACPGESPAVPSLVPFLARIYIFQGHLHKAAAVCREFLGPIKEKGTRFFNSPGSMEIVLGEALYEAHSLEEAEQYIRAGLRANEPWENVMTNGFGFIALTLVLQAKGDIPGALQALHTLETKLQMTARPREFDEQLRTLRVRLQLAEGQLVNASAWADQIRLSEDFQIHPERYRVTLALIRLHQGQYAEAEEILLPEPSLEQAPNHAIRQIETYLLRAAALAGQQRATEAYQWVDTCLAVAEQEGYLQVFLNIGAPASALLAAYLRSGAGAHQRFARAVLDAFSPARTVGSPDPQQAGLVEPLSRREVEILQLIAEGKNNPEIAHQLVVSTGTIKAHAASIYRKLDVANRTEAVARARQLGILS